MNEKLVTRREAIAKTALAGLILPIIGASRGLGADAAAAAASGQAAGARLELGIATYSLRKLSIDAAIAALQAMQVKTVSVYSAHVPILISTPEVCREAAQKFRSAGITITSTGVVTLSNSESVMRRAFECGRAAGLATMTASYAEHPDRDTLLLTERFVREYDIKLAFHNHGPTDKAFPSPFDVWNAVQPYDRRMGLCIDVGHTARAGVDPVEAILKCSDRLYDVHMKDLLGGTGGKEYEAVGLGFGRLDIRAMMAALIKVGFRFQVGLEDEVKADDPVPGVAQSFGYMRGMLAGLP
jgi:sugar phosphate isomerase/epimerase